MHTHKYLGINLIKEVKDLYTENDKTLIKEIKEDSKKWKYIPRSSIGRINIVKMSIPPKAIYRFNTIPIKLPMKFFTELEQTIQKFIWKHKRPRIANAILRGGVETSRRYNSPRLQTILQSYSNQDSVVLVQKQTYRPMEQYRETRDNPDTYGQLIFHKGGKNIKWEEESLFSKWCWENWTAVCKSVKLEDNSHHAQKINLQWLKGLNIRQDTIKLLKENIGKTFSDINCTNVFLGQSPKTIEIKRKINKWDLIKLTRFLNSKGNYQKQKEN